jgi:hypothetical protein
MNGTAAKPNGDVAILTCNILDKMSCRPIYDVIPGRCDVIVRLRLYSIASGLKQEKPLTPIVHLVPAPRITF